MKGRILDAVTAAATAWVGTVVTGVMDTAVTEIRILDARENHAAVEGTWTPHGARARAIRRRWRRVDESIENHAAAEGAAP